ncbi:MAG: ATP-grasp domain-containing protein, partial [Muribaculum sp.]|nr:ATP-grasp domain-containing protein [Muribaculum sp.]
AFKDLDRFSFPLIVKPTDSAGSKGVTRIDAPEELQEAFAHALDNSISGNVIIEEFIEKEGCSSDSDCFSVDGKLEIVTFSNQYFDEKAAGVYTPAAFSWPSAMSRLHQAELESELQRLITLLNLKTSIYNIETRVGKNGKPYIMEVSPRGGGNRLAEMVRYGIGVDMITAYVRATVGDPIGELKPAEFNGYWAEVILHADSEGKFESLEISPEYKDNVFETDLWVNPGDLVRPFNGANDAIGTLVLRFPDTQTLEKAMSTIPQWCKVVVSNGQ